jgi:putative acetyltransferase
MIEIRKEQPEDIPTIRIINEQAFGQPHEANVIGTLRQLCDEFLSLVAIVEGRLVGHILFSPVTIEHSVNVVQGMGLAPMAVLPEYQRQGNRLKADCVWPCHTEKAIMSFCYRPGTPGLLSPFWV